MESKQNPFSVYDFLGYLIPGAIFIYGITLAAPLLGLSWPRYLPAVSPSLFKHPDLYVPFAILAYVIGHALSFLSSVFVERYNLWTVGYPSKRLLKVNCPGYFEIRSDEHHRKKRCCARAVFGVINLPFSFWDAFFERTFKLRDLYAKPLDANIISLIKRKLWIFVGRELGIFKQRARDKKTAGDFVLDTTDYFRPIYHYVLEKFPNHTAPLKNYVALYGFLRTLTFLFTAMFWLAVIKFFLIWQRIVFTPLGQYDQVLWDKYQMLGVCIIATSFASYIFYMAFGKFYRRFSLETLMAFASNYAEGPPEDTDDGYATSVLRPKPEKPVIITPQ